MVKLCPLLIVVLLAGCGGNPQPEFHPMADIPIINPNDPDSIERWESSAYNFADSKITVTKLRFLHGTLGDTSPKSVKSVALHVSAAKTAGISPEQQNAIDDLILNERAIHTAIRTAVYENYTLSYPAYREGVSLGLAMFGGTDSVDDILPPVINGNELDELVEIQTIFVHSLYNGTVTIGVECLAPWDEEHGIGLQVCGEIVTRVGTAHEAYPVPRR
jgi:hypothetical protein